MTDPRQVSIVVQGPVHGRPDDPLERQTTRRVLARAREVYPGAEIILSTWANTPVTGLDYDKLVFSADPGAIPQNDGPQRHVLNNLNRQLVCTRAGLALATRLYAIKLRSDCVLERPLDFSQLDRLPRTPEWSLLQSRVIVSTLFTRHPFRRPLLFHLSDLFLAGLTADLRTLWEIPDVEEPAHTRAIDPANRPRVDAFPEWALELRCASEQYLGEQLARRKEPSLRLRHYSDGSTSALFLWLRVLANNILVLRYEDLGVTFPPRLADQRGDWDLFGSTEQEWSWLSLWARPRVPLLQRACAAVCYTRQRWTYSRPGPLRTTMRLLLKGPLSVLRLLTPPPF